MTTLYTKSPKRVSLPKLKGKNAVEAVLGSKGRKIIDMADSSGRYSAEVYEILEECADMLTEESESICEDVTTAITNIYNDDWVRSRWLTGNLRGSLDIIGKFPLDTSVEIDMAKFLEPKKLPALKTLTTTVTYKRKKTKDSITKTYTKYNHGDIVSITGHDYTTPMDHAIFETIADKYMKKVGF